MLIDEIEDMEFSETLYIDKLDPGETILDVIDLETTPLEGIMKLRCVRGNVDTGDEIILVVIELADEVNICIELNKDIKDARAHAFCLPLLKKLEELKQEWRHSLSSVLH